MKKQKNMHFFFKKWLKDGNPPNFATKFFLDTMINTSFEKVYLQLLIITKLTTSDFKIFNL